MSFEILYRFDLMVVLEGKSDGHQHQQDSPSGDNECLLKSPWQSVQYLFRYFSRDQKLSAVPIAMPIALAGKVHVSWL